MPVSRERVEHAKTVVETFGEFNVPLPGYEPIGSKLSGKKVLEKLREHNRGKLPSWATEINPQHTYIFNLFDDGRGGMKSVTHPVFDKKSQELLDSAISTLDQAARKGVR